MTQKIQNYNCDGLCIQQCCSKRYTHHTTHIINGMELHLGFCEEHADEYDNYELHKIKK